MNDFKMGYFFVEMKKGAARVVLDVLLGSISFIIIIIKKKILALQRHLLN